MIITLGIDTQIGVAEAVITFAKETKAGERLSKRGTWIVTVIVCIVGWLLSLPCTTGERTAPLLCLPPLRCHRH